MANKAKAVKKLPKTQSRLDGSARLKATAKAVGSKLEFETRALACHGKTVAEAIRKTDGPRYRLADLRYDMKAGRVALLKKGESPGPKPKPKADRPVAPKSGQPMPKATLDEFFQFLSCQLQIQSREHCDELPVKDKAAAALFPQVDMHVKPNLGNTERWVPYHTVLGVHELFLMEAVHSRKDWTEKQKFFAIFVFRAHCKRDLFTQAQLPLMLSKTFWKDPRKAFEAEGPMELAIRAYRAKTKKPLAVEHGGHFTLHAKLSAPRVHRVHLRQLAKRCLGFRLVPAASFRGAANGLPMGCQCLRLNETCRGRHWKTLKWW